MCIAFSSSLPAGFNTVTSFLSQICMREYGQGHQVQNEVVSQMIDTAIEIVSDAMP
jgi:hypothetical protein